MTDVKKEPVIWNEDYTPLDLMIAELKEKFEHYEAREQQVTMWRATYKAMMTNTQLAVHAPTGTGKSLGYIIPAMAAKLANPDFRATFSTYTLNLQEQLVKDLELGLELYTSVRGKNEAFKKSKKHPTYSMLKGTSNYFCMNRLGEASQTLSEKRIATLEEKSKSGIPWDRQSFDLSMPNKDWDAVSVQGCIRNACPFADDCTYFKTYDNFASNDFFILNHSLFITRFYFIEPWNDVSFFVFDEAHKLEKSLLDTYTFNVSAYLVRSWKDLASSIVRKYKLSEVELSKWIERHFTDDNASYKFIMDFFNSLSPMFENQPFNRAINFKKTGVTKQTLQHFTETFVLWTKSMYIDYNNLFIAPAEENKSKDANKIKNEAQNWLKKIMNLEEFAKVGFGVDDLGEIWFEANFRNEVSLNATPKNTKYIPKFFDRGSLVTSGTLAEGDSCAGFAERMRMNIQEDIVLTSPFFLGDQTIAYVSPNISPKNPDKNAYMRELEYEIMALLEAGRQKTFILFTSNKLMKDMHRLLEERIRSMDTYMDQPIEVWLQEKGNNKRVIASFKDESVRSVLFGTLSYFEGIDLKGETLTQIILTKLPFSVPSHPVQEILDSNSSYSQWEAVVRYEQAFGRLIRTEFDYGAFCLLDNRVSYMRGFLEPFVREDITITNDISDVARFFNTQK